MSETLPVAQNLTIVKGDSFNSFGVQWKPGDVAADLTGYTAKCFFKRDPNSATADFECTTENDRLVITALTGTVMFDISPDDTATLSGTYSYDLKIISGDESNVVTLIKGLVTVTPTVTP